MLEEVYRRGGSAEYLVVPGIGELYWPALSAVEKAFVNGWLAARQYVARSPQQLGWPDDFARPLKDLLNGAEEKE